VTDAAFDRTLDHLVAVLVEHGIGAREILEIGSRLLPLRFDICERAEQLDYAGRSNRLE
jgi:hypothetical protein